MNFTELREIIEEWDSRKAPLEAKESELINKIREVRDSINLMDRQYYEILGGNKEKSRYEPIPEQVLEDAVYSSQLKELVSIFEKAGYSTYIQDMPLLSFRIRKRMKNVHLVPAAEAIDYTPSKSFDSELNIRFFGDLRDTFKYLDESGNVIRDIHYTISMIDKDDYLVRFYLESVKDNIEVVLEKEDFNEEGITMHVKYIDEISESISSGKRPILFGFTSKSAHSNH